MTRRQIIGLVSEIGQAVALVVGAHFFGAIWAGLAWSLLVAIRFWRATDRQATLSRLGVELMLGLSLVILVALNRLWPTQVVLGAVYLVWRLSGDRPDNLKLRLWRLGFALFISLAAIFTATAIWRWPVLVVVVLAWLVSWLVARELLAPGERGAAALAAAWALVAAEISYLFAIWLVSYILPGNSLIVPQAAIVLVALGYCFMSIYIAHINAKLSRSRLAEYVIIGLCLLVIVMAGTKWNGAI